MNATKKGVTAMTTDSRTIDGCSHVLPDEGDVIRIFDEEIVVKVEGADTGGAYTVLSGSVAPGGGPPLHAHRTSETCYVLAGEFEFTQRTPRGITVFRAGPGAIVNAPAGVPHRFENVRPTRSTMLIVASPELVGYLRALGAAFPPGARPDTERMLALNARYGIETFYGEEGSRHEQSMTMRSADD
jgi:quercetin dioxygenase-like cupin family protein